jgi:hypothetical protein
MVKGKQRKDIPCNEQGVPLDKIGVPMMLLEGCTDYWVSVTPKEKRQSFSAVLLFILCFQSNIF